MNLKIIIPTKVILSIGRKNVQIFNAVPYHRTTQRAKWNEKARIYEAWKKYVVNRFIEKTRDKIHILRVQWGKKPIKNGKGMRVDVMCYFYNGRHGDVENCRKAGLDALFENDKYVIGDSDYHKDEKRDPIFVKDPRLEITIHC